MEAKDYVTLTISILALLISGIGAYFAHFRQVDDLRVVLNQPANSDVGLSGDIEMDQSGRKVAGSAYANTTLTFMNLGNRQAAIMGLSVEAKETDTIDLTERDCYRIGRVNSGFAGVTSLKPFSIKPGEVLVTQVHMDKPTPVTFRLKENDPTPVVRVYVCFWFEFLIPDNIVRTNSVPAWYVEVPLSELKPNQFRLVPAKNGPFIGGPAVTLIDEVQIFAVLISTELQISATSV